MEDGIVYVFGQLDTMVMVFDGLAYLYSSGNTFFSGGTGLGLGIAATMAAILNILMSFGSYTTENKINMHGPLIGLSMYALIAIPTVNRMFVQDIYSGTTVAVQDVPLGIAVVSQISSTLFFYTAEYFEDAFDNSAMHGTAFVSKVTTGNGFMSPLKTLMYLRQEATNVTPKPLVYNIVAYAKDCVGRSQTNGTSASRYDHSLFVTSIDPFGSVFLNPAFIDASLFIQQMNTDGTTSFVTCGDLGTYLNADATSPGSIDNYFTDANTYGRSLLNKLAMANENELSACANSGAACSTNASAITKTEDIIAQVAGGNAQAKEYMQIAIANDFNMMITAANGLNNQSTADVVSSMRYSIELTRASEAMEGEMFLHFMMKALNGFLAVVYALFPIAMIIMVLQGINAMSYFGKYIIMVFWLQSWVPVAALINYISISNLRDAMKAIEDTTGFTIGSSDAVYQAAMDAVVTGSNLLAATPLISLVILTGSYFALTSAASGTASPSGGSGAAARMSTPAPHGGSPVLSMASQYGDVTGTGNSTMSTGNIIKGGHSNVGDTSTSSNAQRAVQAQAQQLESVTSNAVRSTAQSVSAQASSQKVDYSMENMSTGAQGFTKAAGEAYNASHTNNADLNTKEGVKQALDYAMGGGASAVATVYDSHQNGVASSGEPAGSNPISSLVDGAEMVAPEFAPEIEAARAVGLLPQRGGDEGGNAEGNSGGNNEGNTGVKGYGIASLNAKGSHTESSDQQSGEGTTVSNGSASSTSGVVSNGHTDSDGIKSGNTRSDGTSKTWTDTKVQDNLSQMKKAFSEAQQFSQENQNALQSTRAYQASDGDRVATAMSKIADNAGGGAGSPAVALAQSQSSQVRNAALDNGYSDAQADQLVGQYEAHRAQVADTGGLSGADGLVLAGMQSFSTFQNNNPEHAGVMSDAQQGFDQVLDPSRNQLVNPSSNQETIDGVRTSAASPTSLEARGAALNEGQGPSRGGSAGQQTAQTASDNFEGRMGMPSHEREAQAENGQVSPQKDLGSPGDMHRPKEAVSNANADYNNGATLGEAYFSDDAKQKFSQHVHGEDYSKLDNGQKAEVSQSLNTAALGQADNFINSMRGEGSDIAQSTMASDYAKTSDDMASNAGGMDVTSMLDSKAGNDLDTAVKSHTGRETAAANVNEVGGDVNQQRSSAVDNVLSNGTDNNPNWLSEQENTDFGNLAQKLESENDIGGAQALWNEHVSQNVSNPATQESLMIDTSDTSRTPSAQLASANEANGGTFSAPSTDLGDAIVTGGSDNLGGVLDFGASVANSVTGSVASLGESTSSLLSPSDGSGFISNVSSDSFGASTINSVIDSVNDTAQGAAGSISNSTAQVSSSLRITPSEGSSGGTQQNVRDAVSAEYQSMNLSSPQQQQFNESFNQNLSNISGQSSSIDLNKPLDVGKASDVSATHISDAFVATKNDFANDQK
jgi:hypothetical protein